MGDDMVRSTRDRIAGIFSIIVFSVIFVSGAVLVAEVQDKDNANQRAAWGQEMICSVTDQDPVTGQENPLIAYRGRIQREVTVTCGDNQPHSAMMTREDSRRPTTSVWYNSKTGENFIRYDLDTSFNGLSPAIWSNWPFLLIPFAIVAIVAGLLVRAWVRYDRPRSSALVTPVRASH